MFTVDVKQQCNNKKNLEGLKCFVKGLDFFLLALCGCVCGGGGGGGGGLRFSTSPSVKKITPTPPPHTHTHTHKGSRKNSDPLTKHFKTSYLLAARHIRTLLTYDNPVLLSGPAEY